jgi:hypothetical protein
MRIAVALIVVASLVLLGVRSAVQPSTGILLDAIRELGPISGWRCAQAGPYVYDPRRERPDATLFAEAPEATIQATVSGVEVERVEANLLGGDTVVWSHVGAQRRVYVVSPGRSRTIGMDLEVGRAAICMSELGAWHIVAEHALE